MSSVKAVENAQAVKPAAAARARLDVANCKEDTNNKVSEAITAKTNIIKLANTKIKDTKKREQIAWRALIVTLFCCLIAYPTFLEDTWEFVEVSALWGCNNLSTHAKCTTTPLYYSKIIDGSEKFFAYSVRAAWILKFLSFALLIASIAGICYGMYKLWLYYRKCWYSLTLRVLLISLAAMIVFGAGIKSLMNINIVLLMGIIQSVYFGVLIYLDGYFKDHHKLLIGQGYRIVKLKSGVSSSLLLAQQTNLKHVILL